MPHGWFRMYAMVLEFLAYLAVFGYAGWWLDQRRGWEPWGVMSGLILGTSLGVYRMIRESKRLGL
jgi:F0F1-type ATP synthase assembly protein I